MTENQNKLGEIVDGITQVVQSMIVDLEREERDLERLTVETSNAIGMEMERLLQNGESLLVKWNTVKGEERCKVLQSFETFNGFPYVPSGNGHNREGLNMGQNNLVAFVADDRTDYDDGRQGSNAVWNTVKLSNMETFEIVSAF
jgi:hypothetical protein